MKRFKSLLFLMTGTVALLCAGARAQVGVLPKNDTQLTDASDPKFHVGDVWEYKTRSGEENSRLTVVKIDTSPELGIIVHIAVDNLTWKDCQNKPLPQSVPHMPFARKALEVSLSKQTGAVQSLPDYRNGYEEWKAAYSKKRAGIYMVEVRDAVSIAESTYRAGIGCDSEANRQTASR
jgi:hypothetical protein